MDEPIKMPFALKTRVEPTNHVLDGVAAFLSGNVFGRINEVVREWLDIVWCSVCLSLTFVTFFVKKYFF